MYDCIVIGSGIGGLAAAGLLARVADKRVLVLEKHLEPGGLTHTFRRDGASWDVGVHYLGEMGPDDGMFQYLDYLSAGELKFNQMPEGFDRFVYPDIDFTVPSDPDEYQDKLIELFPAEQRAIRRYFRDIKRAYRWNIIRMSRAMVPGFIDPIFALIEKLTGRTATSTTGDYLKKNFRSPVLRALLVSQWGDYGLPPSRSAFAIHSLVINSYLHGAWFPQGGSARIARTIEKTIERSGGAVRVGQEVTKILVEDGRAVGVAAIDRRGLNRQEVTYRAPLVISNAGAKLTFEKFLPTDGEIGRLTQKSRQIIKNSGPGSSSISVYL
ncbi:MAG: all-trans-retinol 13,14-reductase, partial [Propionibacterium sp.]